MKKSLSGPVVAVMLAAATGEAPVADGRIALGVGKDKALRIRAVR